MAEFSPVSPDLAQRAVGIELPAAPAGGFVAGSQVTVGLSSLLFAAADGQSTEVVLSVGGTVLAQGALDTTPVVATDEFGNATLTFTVPASLAGTTAVIDVTVPGNGTAVSFLLPVAAAPTVTPPPTTPTTPTTPATPAKPVTAKPSYTG